MKNISKIKSIVVIFVLVAVVSMAIFFLRMRMSYKIDTFGIIEDNYSAEVIADGSMIFTVNSGGRQGEWTIDLVPEIFKPDFFNNLENGCAEFHIIPIGEGKEDMVIRFTSDEGVVEQYNLTLTISQHKWKYLQIESVKFSECKK